MPKTWDLAERTMEFAVAVFKLCRKLPSNDESRVVTRQLRRAASSVAANYRATRRTPSDEAFAAKLSAVIEEADEVGFWLEFAVRVELVARDKVSSSSSEANELVAIFTASRKTVKARIAARAAAKRGAKR